jgi:hypothetical protein
MPDDDSRSLVRQLRPAKIIVKPTDPAKEKRTFGPASSWGRQQLRDLNVRHYTKREFDVSKILKVDVNKLPAVMQASKFSQRLRALKPLQD